MSCLIVGYAAKRIFYKKDGEKVPPPCWWPSHVPFEGISDVMLAENVRDAYEAGRQYYKSIHNDEVSSLYQYFAIKSSV